MMPEVTYVTCVRRYILSASDQAIGICQGVWLNILAQHAIWVGNDSSQLLKYVLVC
jgi:hypothetical protein